MADLLTTAQAAHYAGVKPENFDRWAKLRHLAPRRLDAGRTTVLLWSRADLIAADAAHDTAARRKRVEKRWMLAS